jgi:hypothetical protein
VGVAELREVAGWRTDLLAEQAGVGLGFAERQGQHEQALAEQIARLCRLAVARDLIQLSGSRPRPELRDLAERLGVFP